MKESIGIDTSTIRNLLFILGLLFSSWTILLVPPAYL